MSSSAASVAPTRQIRGTIRVPGDKSISHRYALIAALAEGRTQIENYAPGTDCQSTLDCLRSLGVDISVDSTGRVVITGRPLGSLQAPTGAIDAGNSGSTMRMIAGILAAQPYSATLIGDESLSRRPMRRIIEPLESMGALIESTDGHAPLTIHGGALHGITHQPATPSAQVKSAVLFAGLHADGLTTLVESTRTRDHTERALSVFGWTVDVEGPRVSVRGGQRGHGLCLSVPGDFSSAAYWMIAAAALPGSRIEIEGVGLNPTRSSLLRVLRHFGAKVSAIEDHGPGQGEPRGTIVVEGDQLGNLVIGPKEVPGLIDELPALAALAAAGGAVSVRGAAELRVKESDRIAVLVAGLRALGIAAEECPDGFDVQGAGFPTGGVVHAHGDHRMAMTFAIAALAGQGPSRINGSDAVAISYPGFFETLDRLVM